MQKVLILAAAMLLLMSTVALADHIFSDVPDNHTHASGIHWAAENGVVRGFADGTFRPRDNIQRGQAATMFSQYHELVEELIADVEGEPGPPGPQVTAIASGGGQIASVIPAETPTLLAAATIAAPTSGGAIHMSGGASFFNDEVTVGVAYLTVGACDQEPVFTLAWWQTLAVVDSAQLAFTVTAPQGTLTLSLCGLAGNPTEVDSANIELIWVPDGGQLADAQVQEADTSVSELLDRLKTRQETLD